MDFSFLDDAIVTFAAAAAAAAAASVVVVVWPLYPCTQTKARVIRHN